MESRETQETGNNYNAATSNDNNDEYNLDNISVEIYPSNGRVSEINRHREEKKTCPYYTEQPRSQTMGGLNGYNQNPQNQFATNANEYQFDDLFNFNEPVQPGGDANYYATYAKPENYRNPFDDAKSLYMDNRAPKF